MIRMVLAWIGTIYYLWCSVGFVCLIGWVFHEVGTGRQGRWMLFLVPLYALLSWSFFKIFQVKLKKIKDQTLISN
jgi:hypothetical protein